MIRNDWKVAFTYIGAVVGAGFASGQELMRFFVVFYNGGLIGTLLAGIIFAILGGLVIYLTSKFNTKDYGQFFRNILPEKLSIVIEIIIAISLWIGLGIMLIGSSTLLNERLDLNIYVGFFFTGLLVFLCLQIGSNGLLNTNTILVPILIIFAIGSSLIYIFCPIPCIKNDGIINLLPNWWSASLLYVAYNMILGIVVLASIQDNKNKITPWGGILGGAILGVMCFIMVKALQLLPKSLLSAEMPMLVLTFSINKIIGNIYSLSLWIAIFTTALANAYSLTNRLSCIIQKPYRVILGVLLLSTLLFIPWSFSTLVGLIYPVEGYLAIPIILAVVLAVIKQQFR